MGKMDESMAEMHETWMRAALTAAGEAANAGEVPIGACIVSASGELLASAFNLTVENSDPTAHAEILAIRDAAASLGNYRLTGATLYTTIEPCVMCAGAILNARISRLVFGARDERFGAVESHFQLCDSAILNHRLEVVSDILSAQSREMIQQFFRRRRSEIRAIRETQSLT